MARSLAILGSARSGGHTAALLTRLIDGFDCEVIDLNAAKVAGFRYDQQYPGDDEFLALTITLGLTVGVLALVVRAMVKRREVRSS